VLERGERRSRANLASDQATMTTEIGGKPIVETITVADER
jgi:hypothetical protein